MVSLKNSNKNCAVLRGNTDLTPKIGCPTRWGSNHNMLTTYQQMREAIIEANEDENSKLLLLLSNIAMPPNINGASFKKAVNNASLIMADINDIGAMVP